MTTLDKGATIAQLIKRKKSEPRPTGYCWSHSKHDKYRAGARQNTSIAQFQITALYGTVFGIVVPTKVLAGLRVAEIVWKASTFVNFVAFSPGFESNVTFGADVQPRRAYISLSLLIALSPTLFRITVVALEGETWKRAKRLVYPALPVGFVRVMESLESYEFCNFVFLAWEVMHFNCGSLKVIENDIYGKNH